MKMKTTIQHICFSPVHLTNEPVSIKSEVKVYLHEQGGVILLE